MQRKQIPGGVRLGDELVWLEFELVRPGVLLFSSRGRMSREFTAPCCEELGRLIEVHAPLWLFNDSGETTGYDSEFRIGLIDLLRSDVERVPEIHFYTTNRLIAMGAAVAGIALRQRIVSYTDRAEFERALARADPQARPSWRR